MPIKLNDTEAALMLHIVQYYMSSKGNEISANTEQLFAKLDGYVNAANSTSPWSREPKVNERNERTLKLNQCRICFRWLNSSDECDRHLFIKFCKQVWENPDHDLLAALAKVSGQLPEKWLPQQSENALTGPYVRLNIKSISLSAQSRLFDLLSNSLNVFEWDTKGLYFLCTACNNSQCVQLRAAEQEGKQCMTCGKPAHWRW